jgi:hypothetical protein
MEPEPAVDASVEVQPTAPAIKIGDKVECVPPSPYPAAPPALRRRPCRLCCPC